MQLAHLSDQLRQAQLSHEINREHRLRLTAPRDPLLKDVQEILPLSGREGMPCDRRDMVVQILTGLLCAGVLEASL
jgi:hypothetical protein